VQAQLRSQFGSRGGMGSAGAQRNNGQPTGGATPATPNAGRVSVSPGEVALDPSPQQGTGRGQGGRQGFQQIEVTDKQCADVKTAMDKKPNEAKKLDGLRDRMRSGELDRNAMRGEQQKIYAAIGVDAQIAGACRMRDMRAQPNAASPNAALLNGAPRVTPAADNTQGGRQQLQLGDTERGGSGRAIRPGLVFVVKGKSYEPRVVMLGAGNFDYTEVVSGLQEGEQVALLSALSVQAQRQQQTDRFRQNMGGGVPGMSQGTPGGGGPRGGR